MANTVRVWDLPTRVFHWALVACITGLLISGWRGGALMDWHARIGYAALALLLFRVVWGMVGGRWSRFTSFLYAPRTIVNYVRGLAHPDHLVGHNPVGAGAVFAILLVLLAQVGTGLVGDDEISFTGPLNKFVESSKGLAATWYHKNVGQWLVIGLIVLHVAAVLFYLARRRDNLIRPMLTGDKTVGHQVVPSRDDAASRAAALVVFGACAAAVAWLVKLGN
jgi:cytochrome b